MTIATLTFDSREPDQIRLILHGDVTQIVALKDRNTALELWRVLTIAYHEDHDGSIAVNIDGRVHTMPQSVWHAVLSVVDQWLEKSKVLDTAD